MIDISIIILNFNTKKLLKRCLYSINRSDLSSSRSDLYRAEVIVVDNKSDDSSAEMVEELIKRRSFRKKTWHFKLIKNRKNLGFAAGNNRGIRRAEGRYILLLNSDTLVAKDTLQKMIEFMDESPNYGAATCKVLLENGKLDPACHRGFPTPWNSFCYFAGLEKLFPKFFLFSGYHQGRKDLNSIHQIDVISGAFFFIKKQVVKKVGLLDEDYFMYGEDIDWCWRIKEKDFRIAFYPDTKITHVKGRSGKQRRLGKEEDLKIKKQSTNQFFETMKIFYKKHYTSRYPKIFMKFVFKAIDFMKKKG